MFNWFNRIAILLFSFLSLTVYFQHEHNHELSVELTAANHALDDADAMINANRIAQQRADELDKKYTEQLADAQTQIDKLRSDVLTGHSQLRVSAKCVSDNSTSRSLGDAASPRLTNTAQSNYWILRERIELSEKQVDYLQDYIREMQRGE